MLLVLRDTDPHVVLAFTQVFGGHDGVSVGSGDLLAAGVDAIVSPANSFGRMDGGIDLHYRNQLGLGLERLLRELIARRYENGELPVGEAIVVPTKHGSIKRMIAAPTMRTPQNIRGTDNVRRATLAALRMAAGVREPAIARLGMPGMGTGVGRMDPFDAAEQMFDGWQQWLKEARSGSSSGDQSPGSSKIPS
jgi:O-acetyl-ADP-ribose deacetylase (regulator of RNase III)